MKSQKKKKFLMISLFFFSFFLQTQSFAKIEIVLGNLPHEQNPNLAIKVPEAQSSEILVSREQYVISYNKDRRSANWVAWKLESEQIGKSGRSNNFQQDSDLENYLQQTYSGKHAVESNEYKGSCYDRGHQIPSADRTDILTNNETTFLMSNMIPQTPYLNRVIWEHLEQHTRNLVQTQNKKAYIIVGPIYDRNLGNIGPKNDIPVPSKNFKIIFVLDSEQKPQDINKDTPVIAVIMPNINQDGTLPEFSPNKKCKSPIINTTDKNDWKKYLTTIGEIEKESGLKIISPTTSL